MSEHKVREHLEQAERKQKKSKPRNPERPQRAAKGEMKGETKLLKGKHVAILATDGFEQSELTDTRDALDRAGATTTVIAPHAGAIKGWQMRDWGDEVDVDLTLDKAHADDYDALLLPGGVLNPDKLRTDIRNAGAQWSDEEVVVDRGLVTSRKPADIPAFNRKMIQEFAESAVSTRTDRSTIE